MSNVTGYIRHFIACNRHDLNAFVPFFIGGKRYGYVGRELAGVLAREPEIVATPEALTLSPAFGDFASRSDALMRLTRIVAAHYNKPLRDEMYAVVRSWEQDPLAQIDRAAIPWLGLRAWGVHVNGFVRKANGLHLWIGERAADRLADPGKLDNMVGGGQPIGLTLEQNLCKEAKEEAGIDAALALTAKLSRPINYRVARSDGLRTDTLFIYDLELPEDFTPRNTDGEVAAFHLLPLSEVANLVRDTDRFKFNCTLVVIDFMLRHGFITPQDAEYAGLTTWLTQDSAHETN